MSVARVGAMIIGTPDDQELMSRLVRDLGRFDIEASATSVRSGPLTTFGLGPDYSAAILLWTRAAAGSDWISGSIGAVRRAAPVVVADCGSAEPPPDGEGLRVVDITAWQADADAGSLQALAAAVREVGEGSPEPSRSSPSSVPPVQQEVPSDKEPPEWDRETLRSTPDADLSRLRPGTVELLVLADQIAQGRNAPATAVDVVLAGVLRPAVSGLDRAELASGAAYALYAVVPDPKDDHLAAAVRACAGPHASLKELEGPDPALAPSALSRSPVLVALVDEASRLAAEVSPSVATASPPRRVEVYSHHLLGVAMAQSSLPPMVATALGINDDGLRTALLDTITDSYPQENAQRWTARLARPPAEAVATFHHDDTRQRDLLAEDSLDIEPHVRALALLVTAKVLQPPLAVGLFGDWGSGKTYFMRALRQEVDRLTLQARRSELPQRELPLYRNVAQIEFNAWHFVDADLWASLADYIFANLRITEGERPDEVNRRRRLYVRKLSEQGAAIRQVETERQRLHAQIELSETELEHVRAQTRLKLGAVQQSRAVVSASDTLRRDVDGLAVQLGLPQVGSSLADLESSLVEARATAVGARSTVGALSGRYGDGWSLLALGALLLGPLVLWLTTLVDIEGTQRWAASAAGVIGGAAAWVRTASSAVSSTLTKIDDLRAALEREVEKDDVVIEQREALAGLRAKEMELSQQETALRARLAKVEQALRELSPAKLLADFILSRNDSDDYRKHLGLASLIRKDFEALAQHIDDFNASLEEPDTSPSAAPETRHGEPTDPGEDVIGSAGQDRADVLGTGADAPSEVEYHVNRIVLYIDDLDRCPPETVAKVLQAVHLLLAFPLFVVVVGVDSRWLSRSLTKHYEGLLDSTESDVHDSASPQDYLEKIFQIPFWLRPMPLDATGRLLSALTDAHPSPEPGSQGSDSGAAAEGEAGSGRSHRTDGRGPMISRDAASRTRSPRSSGPTAEPAVSADDGSDRAPQGTNGEVTDDGSAPPPYDLRISSTAVTQRERDFMEDLRAMLGRSPRSLTRYVNIFRLLKAVDQHGRTADQRDRPGVEPDPDAVTMFLLAVLTGFPDVAQPLLTEITRPASKPEEGDGLREVVQRARLRVDEQEQVPRGGHPPAAVHAAQWDLLDQWLDDHEEWVREQRVGTWGPKALVVARYSFRSDTIAPRRRRASPSAPPPVGEARTPHSEGTTA